MLDALLESEDVAKGKAAKEKAKKAAKKEKERARKEKEAQVT